MDPFTLFGLGLGLGFAWLMRDLQPLGGSGHTNTTSGSLDDDAHDAIEMPFADALETHDKTAPVTSMVHRSTQLLTDEESEEAAEALRSALGRRR